MSATNKDIAIEKIIGMQKDQVSKVLIFMAGMEAEHIIKEKQEDKQSCESKQQTA